jgi:hypothetical protein
MTQDELDARTLDDKIWDWFHWIFCGRRDCFVCDYIREARAIERKELP